MSQPFQIVSQKSVESASQYRNDFQGSGIGQDMLLGSSIENDIGGYGSTLSTSPDKKSFD